MTYYELIDKLSRRFSEWISYLALKDLAEADLISAIAWTWFSLFTLQILTTGTSIEVKPIIPLKDPITALYVSLLFAIALVLSGGISLLPRLIYARTIEVRKDRIRKVNRVLKMGWISAFIISMLTSILFGSNYIVYTWIYILISIMVANAVSVKIMFKGEDVARKYINACLLTIGLLAVVSIIIMLLDKPPNV